MHDVISLSGTVSSDPEFDLTPTEPPVAVARFEITSTARTWNEAGREWLEMEPLTYLCTVRHRRAQQLGDWLAPGVAVHVAGRVTENTGGRIHVEADDVGTSLGTRHDVITVSGKVMRPPEVRWTTATDPQIAVARFEMRTLPPIWNAAAREWRQVAPLMYVCTMWRRYAEHVGESLTPGVDNLVTGRVTGNKNGRIHIDVDDVGVSLGTRIAYTEASLPGPAAARPQRLASGDGERAEPAQAAR